VAADVVVDVEDDFQKEQQATYRSIQYCSYYYLVLDMGGGSSNNNSCDSTIENNVLSTDESNKIDFSTVRQQSNGPQLANLRLTLTNDMARNAFLSCLREHGIKSDNIFRGV
jgi:hypothetical protein